MSVTSSFKVPIPTPYQSPYYGGSPAVSAGTEGPHVVSPTNTNYGPVYYGPTVPANTGGTVAGTQTTPTTSTNNTQTQQQAPDPNADLNRLVDAMMSKGYTDRNAALQVAQSNFGNLWKEYMGGGDSNSGGISDTLNQGYNDYLAQLDEMLNQGLPSQKAAQENIALNSFNQGQADLNLQKEQSLADYAKQEQLTQTNKVKTLKDIADNLRNSFMAGNIYLGARGAGDSSAANQYSYALTKLGNQQRGDVNSQVTGIMQDIGDKKTALTQIVNNEINKLKTAYDNTVQSIAQWFAEQQNAIKGLKGQALLQKSQELYTQGVNALNQAKQEASNKRTALEQWAMNNATTIQQLTENLAQVSGNAQYVQPKATKIAGTPTTDSSGNLSQAGYTPGGAVTQDKTGALSQYNPLSANYYLR